MNKCMLLGRLTRDPEVKYSQGAEPMAIARYSLAVNRQMKKEGQPDADFINIVAFGKRGEFAQKYFKKGQQVAVVGRIQTGSYDKDGVKVYTTDIIADEQFFADSKRESSNDNPPASQRTYGEFVPVDEEDSSDLPF